MAKRCPVETIAIEVGELWDAFNGAEAREGCEYDFAISRQIEEYRKSLEDLATFHRARSLAGALFQIVLAKQESDDIFAMLSEDDQRGFKDKDYRIERLLESAMNAIKMALGKDFKPLENVMRVYCSELRPIPWLDELPALAVAGRSVVKRSTRAP